MDVQNSFCTYIWHPVQQTGWFFMNTIMNTFMSTFMNTIVNRAMNTGTSRNMNTPVNAEMNRAPRQKGRSRAGVPKFWGTSTTHSWPENLGQPPSEVFRGFAEELLARSAKFNRLNFQPIELSIKFRYERKNLPTEVFTGFSISNDISTWTKYVRLICLNATLLSKCRYRRFG